MRRGKKGGSLEWLHSAWRISIGDTDVVSFENESYKTEVVDGIDSCLWKQICSNWHVTHTKVEMS